MDDIKLINYNGLILASSREIAERFNKSHGSVLKSIQGENRNGCHINGFIDELIENKINPEQYFVHSTYKNRGKEYPEYLMTRDGFSLLVMGFTGTYAFEWKLKYIEAFNIMENEYYTEKSTDTYKTYLYKPKSVYVLLADDGSVKIGVSNNVEYRKHVLENYTGKNITKTYFTPPCSNSFAIEKLSHTYFQENRIYGEWFNIDYSEACTYVSNLYSNMATYIYRNKIDDEKAMIELFRKTHLIKSDNKDIDIEGIKNKLQDFVSKGLLECFPETYEETIKMLCDQKILYYTKLKETMA